MGVGEKSGKGWREMEFYPWRGARRGLWRADWLTDPEGLREKLGVFSKGEKPGRSTEPRGPRAAGSDAPQACVQSRLRAKPVHTTYCVPSATPPNIMPG